MIMSPAPVLGMIDNTILTIMEPEMICYTSDSLNILSTYISKLTVNYSISSLLHHYIH